jgi:hypothetical protein
MSSYSRYPSRVFASSLAPLPRELPVVKPNHSCFDGAPLSMK